MKLFYFDMRGRAEAARIMLRSAEKEFEDVRMSFEEWGGNYKALSPTGQCPWLELDDGTIITQSIALYTYIADYTGFLPSDPLQVAKTLELCLCFEEVFTTMGPTFHIQDKAQRVAARRELIKPEGAMHKKLLVIEKLLEASKTEFYCGDALTMADVIVFVQHASATSGDLDGFTEDDWSSFPCIAKLHSKVAAHSKILPLYADDTTAQGFRPKAA